jgi:hypothetical protein
MVAVFFLLLPAAADAQATITGVVRDTSGAVLPGVTVEAASPALTEKVRSVVTDGSGQYRIVDLRPGLYSVTFTLPGFNAVKREGIELTGSFTATVNADLRVGALEETITVTGETPVVDVQSATRQRVLDQEVLDSIPVNRTTAFMAALVPGVTIAAQDVGGNLGNLISGGAMSVHGSRPTDLLTMANGISIQTLETGSSVQGVPNMAVYEEVAIDSGAADATQALGGVRINVIPRTGTNQFRGSFFGSYANDNVQNDNFSDELKTAGLPTPDRIKELWDVNPSFGGPLKTDRLWFFMTARHTGASNYVAMFYNRNAGNPNAWTYEPDTSRQGANNNPWRNGHIGVTFQANQNNRFNASWDQTAGCNCPRDISATLAPESAQSSWYDPKRQLYGDWTSPVTNKLLLDAVVFHQVEWAKRESPRGNPLNAVTDQATGLTYRAIAGTLATNMARMLSYRVGVSYITGAHAFKFGMNNASGSRDALNYNIDAPVSFRFNNGVPNQLTMQASPWRSRGNLDYDIGLYAQDRWTLNRLTMTLGVRFDTYSNSYPAQEVGPGPLVPTRSLAFAETAGVNWKDITPRAAASYDLLGDGKTAVKVSLNKYVAGQALRGSGITAIFGDGLSPITRLANTTTRSWADANRNFVPDCDLLVTAANGECGAMANPNFGRTTGGNTYDPEILEGWGKRGYNWEFSAGVQREIRPRVSAELSYFRRWFGNFIVTDNRSVSAASYDTYSITAPVDPRLPGGGGYEISGLTDLKPASFGLPADNYLTFASNFGKQIEHWNGVDLTINARPRNGLMLAGGISSGRTSTNNCDVVAQLPEAQVGGTTLAITTGGAVVPRQYCDLTSDFLTSLKMLGSYTIPRIDVLVSGTMQSLPGPQIAANYTATNAVVARSLGRNLAGNAANVTVNLVTPGTMYGERLNQLDLRIAKVIGVGRTRSTLGVDIYNALNANPVTSQSIAYATWQRPQTILTARFLKFSMLVDF